MDAEHFACEARAASSRLRELDRLAALKLTEQAEQANRERRDAELRMLSLGRDELDRLAALKLTEQAEQANRERRDAELRMLSLGRDLLASAAEMLPGRAAAAAVPADRDEGVQVLPPAETADLADLRSQVTRLTIQLSDLRAAQHRLNSENDRHRRGWERLRALLEDYQLSPDGWYRLPAMRLEDYGAACRDAGL